MVLLLSIGAWLPELGPGRRHLPGERPGHRFGDAPQSARPPNSDGLPCPPASAVDVLGSPGYSPAMHEPRRQYRRVAAATVALWLCASCSGTATVHTAGQPAIEGRIIGGDQAWLFVQNSGGELYRVPKSRVHDIDHPGNVLFTVGAVGSGTVMFASTGPSSGQFASQFAPQLAIYGVLLGIGLWQWWDSSAAVHQPLPPGVHALDAPGLQEVR